MTATFVTLTELRYDNDTRGDLTLFIFEGGFHRGGQWFAQKARYPGEQIFRESAREKRS